MPTDAWRFAHTRWGDPIWILAVLSTGNAETAQVAVVDAFCTSYHDHPSDDPEQALYQTLYRHPVRFDRLRQRPLIRRNLRRIAPRDRVLLGLWLLREQSGEQLAATTGETLAEVTARLTRAVIAWKQAQDSLLFSAPMQDDIAELVKERLEAAPSIGSHSRVYATQTTLVDQLRGELQEATRNQHLPAECQVQIEACLHAQQQTAGVRWWQRKAYWQLGIVFLTVAILLALVIPRRTNNPEQAATSTTARALVQVALDRWGATTNHITHRQVWAIDPLHQQTPAVVTDLWLPAGDSAEHRVEMRRGRQLLEWQVANGDRRLNYGAIPSESTCSWTLPTNSTNQMAISFRIPPADQQAALEARLRQGAYGLGYLALERALAAPDLRSFGTRIIASRTFVTLIYSDTFWGPSQQVVLRLDPETGELYGVQTVSVTGAQTRTRDLWRVDVREEADFIPSPLPDWVEGKRTERLIDPGCLHLAADATEDLRTTLDTKGIGWYLPATLPSGTTRGVLLAAGPTESGSASTPVSTVQFTGPGRFLSISPISWIADIAGDDLMERGQWRIAGRVEPGVNTTRLVLFLRHDNNAGVFPRLNPGASGWSLEQTIDSFVAAVSISAQGWTQDELLALVDQLQFATPPIWASLRDSFVTPEPLDATTRTILDQAIAALAPPKTGMIATTAETTIRPRMKLPQLGDPYHIPDELWIPRSTTQRQTLLYGEAGLERFADQRTTSTGLPYILRQSDGTKFVFANYSQGWIVDGDAARLGTMAVPSQPGISMLKMILGSNAPLRITEQDGAWQVERKETRTQDDLNAEPQDPWNEQPWTTSLITGTITYRVWLDRVTSLPQRMEVSHLTGEDRTIVQTTAITERQVSAAIVGWLPPITSENQSDVLAFHWVAGKGPVLDERVLSQQMSGPPYRWTEASGASTQWVLEPVGATEPLALSAFKAPRWFNISRLSAVHRTLYRVDADNYMGILVTQGPKNLMRHVIRYSESLRGADAMPWTTSTRMTVTIDGVDREAWLLAHNGVAALVIDMDDRLIHVMGLRSYLEGPLMEKLPQLTATAP